MKCPDVAAVTSSSGSNGNDNTEFTNKIFPTEARAIDAISIPEKTPQTADFWTVPLPRGWKAVRSLRSREGKDCLSLMPRTASIFVSPCTGARNDRLQQWFLEMA